jgi:hypothetical protein
MGSAETSAHTEILGFFTVKVVTDTVILVFGKSG